MMLKPTEPPTPCPGLLERLLVHLGGVPLTEPECLWIAEAQGLGWLPSPGSGGGAAEGDLCSLSSLL